jgi:hypothetical protein
MPDQAEHEKPENLVEEPHPKIHPAGSLSEEANSNNSLDGYAAMNVPVRKETVDEILAEDEQKKISMTDESPELRSIARIFSRGQHPAVPSQTQTREIADRKDL